MNGKSLPSRRSCAQLCWKWPHSSRGPIQATVDSTRRWRCRRCSGAGRASLAPHRSQFALTADALRLRGVVGETGRAVAQDKCEVKHHGPTSNICFDHETCSDSKTVGQTLLGLRRWRLRRCPSAESKSTKRAADTDSKVPRMPVHRSPREPLALQVARRSVRNWLEDCSLRITGTISLFQGGEMCVAGRQEMVTRFPLRKTQNAVRCVTSGSLEPSDV